VAFGLVVVSFVLFGVALRLMRVTADDKLAAPFMGVASLVGMGAAYWAAWLCALLGTSLGIIGVLNPAHRTTLAWAALAVNGCFALVMSVLILVLSP